MTEHPAVAHLRAALDRAEETARAACPGPWEPEGEDPTDDQIYTAHDGEHGNLVGNPIAYVRSGFWNPDSARTLANMRHIAAFDPNVVLAMVEADRELLDEHSNVNDGSCGTCVDGNWGYPTHGGSSPQRWPCRTLLLRAKAWGWKDEQHG